MVSGRGGPMILDFDSAEASSLRGVMRNDDMDSARSLAASSLIPSSPSAAGAPPASAAMTSFSSLRSLSLFFFLALCPFFLPEPRDEGESDLLLRFDGAGLDGGGFWTAADSIPFFAEVVSRKSTYECSSLKPVSHSEPRQQRNDRETPFFRISTQRRRFRYTQRETKEGTKATAPLCESMAESFGCLERRARGSSRTKSCGPT